MKKQLYLNMLYDYYSSLLTSKQQQYFEDYYFNNLSLGEISENYGVSRNAIHKQIKSVERKLKEYEGKLKLYQKGKRIKELLMEIDQTIYKEIEKLM